MSDSRTKVLIVDDREQNLIALEKILEPCNLNLVRAYSGNEALQKMLEEEFALVLMDVQMPEMDGFETVALMKQDSSLEKTPVIFISAIYREDEHLLKSVESGGVDFIIKPVVAEILIGKVNIFVKLHEDRMKLVSLNSQLEWELFVSRSLGELANLVVSPDFTLEAMEKMVKELSVTMTSSHWVNLSSIAPSTVRSEKTITLMDSPIPEELGLPANRPDIESLLSVPVLYNHRCIGQITLANRSKAYEKKHIQAIQKVSNIFALALHKISEEEKRVQMEAELRQSEKMQAIGQIAGGVAHDFNNQLSMIMGTAELCLVEHPGSESLTTKLESIIEVSSRAGELTRQLLNYSRKGFYSSKEISPSQLIKEVVTVLERTIDKSITINLILKESSSLIHADPTQLYSALLNICINARDAMSGGGKLTIVSEEESIAKKRKSYEDKEIPPGRYLTISIKDTGVGMSQELMTKIFDPFFTTKGLGQGTGMGLSAVLGIIKRHNGFLQVMSQLDVGTTFVIYLPME